MRLVVGWLAWAKVPYMLGAWHLVPNCYARDRVTCDTILYGRELEMLLTQQALLSARFRLFHYYAVAPTITREHWSALLLPQSCG